MTQLPLHTAGLTVPVHLLLRLSVAIAALLLATPAFAGDTLTLTMSPPPPGTKFVEASALNLEINVELSMGPGKSIKQAFSAKTTKKRDVEVLATEADVITKAKVNKEPLRATEALRQHHL